MLARASKSPLFLWALPALVLAAIVLPAALLNVHGGIRISDDSLDYHIPQINQFIKAPFDLVDFPALAPTFPGYHALMGWLARLFGFTTIDDNTWLMKLVNASFTLAAVALAAPLALRARQSDGAAAALRPAEPVLLLLPFALGWYVALTATYYGTEGLGHLCLVLVLWTVTARRPRVAAVSAALALLVFVRHLFAPVLPIAALTRVRPAAPVRSILSGGNLLFAAIAVVPALLVIAIYVAQWKGLIPPGKATEFNRSGLFLHSWLHAFAFLGLASFLYLPLEVRAPRAGLLRGWPALWLAALPAFALVLWLFGPSDYSVDNGRWGSLIWSLARHLPLIAGKSPVVLVLALIGAAFAGYLLVRSWQRETIPVELIVLLLYLAGLGFTQAAHQRYVEPVTALCLGILFCRLATAPRPAWAYAPIVMFAAISALFSIYRLYYVFRLPVTGS